MAAPLAVLHQHRSPNVPRKTQAANLTRETLVSFSLHAPGDQAADALQNAVARRENAADLYKNALVLYHALSTEEQDILMSSPPDLATENSADLFAKIEPVLKLLRRAQTAAIPCSWALSSEAAIQPLPHVHAMLRLVRLSCWAAAYQLSDAPESALGDLAAGLYAAHSVGAEQLLGWATSSAADQMVLDLLQQNLALLTTDVAPLAQRCIGMADSAPQLARAISAEAEAMHRVSGALQDRATFGATRAAVLNVFSGETREQLAALPAAEIAQRFALIETIERAFVERCRLPKPEFNAWCETAAVEAAGDRLAEYTVETLARMYERAGLLASQRDRIESHERTPKAAWRGGA